MKPDRQLSERLTSPFLCSRSSRLSSSADCRGSIRKGASGINIHKANAK